jgi:hypothetical protein
LKLRIEIIPLRARIAADSMSVLQEGRCDQYAVPFFSDKQRKHDAPCLNWQRTSGGLFPGVGRCGPFEQCDRRGLEIVAIDPRCVSGIVASLQGCLMR